MKRNNNNLDFEIETKKPILFYLWWFCSLFVLFLAIINYENVFIFIFILLLIPGFLWFFLCRYSCKIIIKNDRVIFHYLSLFQEDIIIDSRRIKSFDYQKGFLGFSESFENTTHFKIVFYDIIYLNTFEGKMNIKIHSRIGSFRLLKEYLIKEIKNNTPVRQRL
jgi:hypothetical protein